MDQGFHVVLHFFTRGRDHLEIPQHHVAGVGAQPVHALQDDRRGLAHLLDPHQVTVVAVAVDAHRDVELQGVVHRVALLFAQVPFDPGTAQHRAAETELQGAFRRNHADIHGALLPDTVFREQGLVLVHLGGKIAREGLDEVQQAALAPLVLALQVLALGPRGFAILGHAVGEVPVHPAWPIVGRVHARAGDRFVHVHGHFALAKGIQEQGHGAQVQAVGADPQQVIAEPRDLVEHRADVLGAQRRLDAQQLLDRQHVSVLVAHHGHVVEPVHVADRLVEGLGFSEFFGRPVQQPDVGVGAHHGLAVQFQHQAQHAMGRRVLGPEIHRVIADLGHAQSTSRAAWSAAASAARSTSSAL